MALDKAIAHGKEIYFRNCCKKLEQSSNRREKNHG